MGFWNSLFGMVTLELTSADPAGALLALQRENIILQDVIACSQLQYRFRASRLDVPRLRKLTKQRGESLRILQKEGLFWTLRGLMKRPVLVLGMAGLLVFSLWVPGRIFFIRVEGNQSVPDAQIIEQAQLSGIAFGASRREVRSEKLKNQLLDRLPQLQWAGVNTYGCVAVITVRERTDSGQTEQASGIGSIIAARDAVIREMTVVQGTALCKTGQAVKAGQVLISGYTDCGLYIRAQQAQGEIFGQTQRQISAVTPTNYLFRQEILDQEKKFSLIIGKNRINLWKGSGISGTSCAKIETDYDLLLPGGFRLPVKFAVETVMSYVTQTVCVQDTQTLLENFAQHYLCDQMVAGRITGTGQVYTEQEDLCRLVGVYDCYEMIGIIHSEENLLDYGQNH